MSFLSPVPPRIELSIQMKKMLPVKAGSDVCLEAEVFGKPMPKVTWTKNGEAVKADKALKMSQKRHLFYLSFDAVTKLDTGNYEIRAENASGSTTAEIQLKVLGEYNGINLLFYPSAQILLIRWVVTLSSFLFAIK